MLRVKVKKQNPPLLPLKTFCQVPAIEHDGSESAAIFANPIKLLVGPARLELATKGL